MKNAARQAPAIGSERVAAHALSSMSGPDID